jgi:hypothetical protein
MTKTAETTKSQQSTAQEHISIGALLVVLILSNVLFFSQVLTYVS